MTNIEPKPPVHVLGAMARERLHGRSSTTVDARGRARVTATFARGRARGPRRFRAILLAAAACVAVAALLAVVLRPRPMTFVVQGGEIAWSASGGVHVAPSDAPSVASFSDGSVVTFEAGASGRIEDVDARGARVVLAAGEAHVAITPREGARWSIEAGPHVVHVTGTEFTVAWRPTHGTFSVSMIQGSVRVEGPSTPAGVSLEAGYRLDVRPDGTLAIGRRDARPTPEPLTAATSAPPAVAAATGLPTAAVDVVVPPPSAATAAAPSTATPKGPSWTQLVSEGKYGDVVAQARTRGLEEVAQSATLADLVALGDAARYEKDGRAARASLEAQRKRFGETQAGRTATFLLGRLAEDGDGNADRALALYDEYLATGGPFSAEALGRKMALVKRTRGDEAARPIAKTYLEKHPNGGYAKVARAIVGDE
jgi:hypothetical protein